MLYAVKYQTHAWSSALRTQHPLLEGSGVEKHGKIRNEDMQTQSSDLQRTCKGDKGWHCIQRAGKRAARGNYLSEGQEQVRNFQEYLKQIHRVCTFMHIDAKHQTIRGTAHWVYGREQEHRITNWPGSECSDYPYDQQTTRAWTEQSCDIAVKAPCTRAVLPTGCQTADVFVVPDLKYCALTQDDAEEHWTYTFSYALK